jgi:membrane-bound ClpP family serine protease
MVWMMLVMSSPLLGLVLFFVLPLWTAMPIYVVLLAISGSCHWLMMRSMRLPAQMGREAMIGAVAVVLNWKGDAGQIRWNGEIWRAESLAGTPLQKWDRVVIDGLSGLTVFVRPIKQLQAVKRSGQSSCWTQMDREVGEKRYLQ